MKATGLAQRAPVYLITAALAGLLSGCDTVGPASYASRVPAASKLQLPHLDDPQMQAMLDAVAVEYRKYRASGKRYLERPAEAGRWPCAMSPAQLKKLGIVDTDTNPSKKSAGSTTARASRTEPSTVFSNLTVYPVQASCGKGGKLQGPVEFWEEYDRTMDASIFKSYAHVLQHSSFTAKDGEQSGLVMTTMQSLKDETVYKDPNTAAMMAKQAKHNTTAVTFIAKQAGGSAAVVAAMVSITYFDYDSNGVTVNLTTNVTHPLGGDRWEIIRYGLLDDSGGPHKDSVTSYKGGKEHGWTILYPRTALGRALPGERTCWQDGEKIMTTNCPAD